jgi:hypothetical protein
MPFLPHPKWNNLTDDFDHRDFARRLRDEERFRLPAGIIFPHGGKVREAVDDCRSLQPGSCAFWSSGIMATLAPTLACGSMGPGFTALAYTIVTFWGISALLVLSNFVMIVFNNMERRARMIHFSIFMLYVILTVVLFAGGFNWNLLTLALAVFGIPSLVIGQFGSLLIQHRRLRTPSPTGEKNDT